MIRIFCFITTRLVAQRRAQALASNLASAWSKHLAAEVHVVLFRLEHFSDMGEAPQPLGHAVPSHKLFQLRDADGLLLLPDNDWPDYNCGHPLIPSHTELHSVVLRWVHDMLQDTNLGLVVVAGVPRTTLSDTLPLNPNNELLTRAKRLLDHAQEIADDQKRRDSVRSILALKPAERLRMVLIDLDNNPPPDPPDARTHASWKQGLLESDSRSSKKQSNAVQLAARVGTQLNNDHLAKLCAEFSVGDCSPFIELQPMDNKEQLYVISCPHCQPWNLTLKSVDGLIKEICEHEACQHWLRTYQAYKPQDARQLPEPRRGASGK